MARAIWSGSISFGLLNVPVKLYSAVARRGISLREVRASDGARIRHRRVAEGTDEEVPYEEIVKAFEISPDRYVPLSKDEMEALAPEKTRAIEVQDFVDLEQIVISDPQRFVYPIWPPPPLVDLVHWWGTHFDPLQYARPPWWRPFRWAATRWRARPVPTGWPSTSTGTPTWATPR